MAINITRKKRGKPFYKQFLRIRKNVINSPKIFHFKKEKWRRLKELFRRKVKFFKRYKIRDQYRLLTNKFSSRGNSFQKDFRKRLFERKIFNIFYGGLKKKYIKKAINKQKTKLVKYNSFQTFEHQTLKMFESRLDSVIHRSKFTINIKDAKQLILHGHVLVNGKAVRSKSYLVKTGDLIEIAHKVKARKMIQENLNHSNFWPIPPKHLIINYNTCQILVVYDKQLNFLSNLDHYLNINSVINGLKRH